MIYNINDLNDIRVPPLGTPRNMFVKLVILGDEMKIY